MVLAGRYTDPGKLDCYVGAVFLVGKSRVFDLGAFVVGIYYDP